MSKREKVYKGKHIRYGNHFILRKPTSISQKITYLSKNSVQTWYFLWKSINELVWYKITYLMALDKDCCLYILIVPIPQFNLKLSAT